MEILGSLWNILILFFTAFIFVASLIAFFLVLIDLFRDKTLNGWAKAAWILFLVFIPLLTALVYMVARGEGLSDRFYDEMQRRRAASDQYIREVAATSPADEIIKAQALLEAGTITAEEFAALKAHALAGSAGA